MRVPRAFPAWSIACWLLLAMAWTKIKQDLLARHPHAFEFAEDEVRLVLAYRDGQRVPLVVRRLESSVVAIARVASGTVSQIISMLRAATTLGVTLAMIGDSVCVRAVIASDEVEQTLQSTARAALHVRRRTLPTRTDVGAFAFAL